MILGRNMSNRTAIFLSGIALTLLLGGCTYDSRNADSYTTPSSGGPDASTDTKTVPSADFSLPKELPAPTDVGEGEKKITELASQTQGASLGPMTLSKKTVVYIRCAGDGSLIFDMKGVGRFPLPCLRESDTHGTRNVFDTRMVQQTTASVESSPGQIWSIGIYSEPIP